MKVPERELVINVIAASMPPGVEHDVGSAWAASTGMVIAASMPPGVEHNETITCSGCGAAAPPPLAALKIALARDEAALAKQQQIERAREEGEAKRRLAAAERERQQEARAAERERRRQAAEEAP